MPELSLVMPMAGRGSRFMRQGISLPKPLIQLHGRPFFAWAVDSVAASVPLGEIVFVVLREHVREFAIEREIRARYPRARVVVIDDVTAGAADTAAIGVDALRGTGAVAINDCDHAFTASEVSAMLRGMAEGRADAGLLGFRSASPAFSYVEFDAQGKVGRAVEKRVISPFAIAGCYLFSNPAVFALSHEAHSRECQAGERYVSGLFNALIEAGGAVDFCELGHHVAFGTPEELRRVTPQQLRMGARMSA